MTSRQDRALLELLPLPDRIGIRAAGEVCLTTHAVWERVLDELVGLSERSEDVHLELSAVTYVDVAGAGVVAAAAARLEPGRRIVLHRPPAALRLTLATFWPGLPTIEMTPC